MSRFSLRLVFAAFFICAISAFPGSLPDDADRDGLIAYSIPAYPRCGITGTVTVEVRIATDGRVIDATDVSDSMVPGLGGWALDAARKWEFKTGPNTCSATRRLTFVFEGDRWTESTGGVVGRYESPLTLHVEHLQPWLRKLPRIDGEVPPRRCELHGVELEVVVKSMYHGSIDMNSPTGKLLDEYSHAAILDFPNARLVDQEGVTVWGTESEWEIFSCPKCREAREAWLADHPEFELPKWD